MLLFPKQHVPLRNGGNTTTAGGVGVGKDNDADESASTATTANKAGGLYSSCMQLLNVVDPELESAMVSNLEPSISSRYYEVKNGFAQYLISIL
jgi:hypothetical protein